jgi:hypothetical protein
MRVINEEFNLSVAKILVGTKPPAMPAVQKKAMPWGGDRKALLL